MSEGAWPLTVVARETGYMVSTAAASVQRMHSSGTRSSRTWARRVGGTRVEGRGERGEGRDERGEGSGERGEMSGERAAGRGQRAHVA